MQSMLIWNILYQLHYCMLDSLKRVCTINSHGTTNFNHDAETQLNFISRSKEPIRRMPYAIDWDLKFTYQESILYVYCIYLWFVTSLSKRELLTALLGMFSLCAMYCANEVISGWLWITYRNKSSSDHLYLVIWDLIIN